MKSFYGIQQTETVQLRGALIFKVIIKLLVAKNISLKKVRTEDTIPKVAILTSIIRCCLLLRPEITAI